MAYIGEYPPRKKRATCFFVISQDHSRQIMKSSGTFLLRLANCLITLYNLYFNNVLLGKIKNTQPYEIKMK